MSAVPAPTVANPPEISLQGIEQRFGRGEDSVVALTGIDLAVGKREFVVLLGPSGCGKTTLLRIVAGLIRPTTGDVRLQDRPLWSGETRDNAVVQELGVVFQEANLFPWMSVLDNIALPLKLRGAPAADRRGRARALCDLVGIAGFERRWPRELSGGMRQRAAIARALSYDPRILLMDEPFGALDPLTRREMQDHLIGLQRRFRKTIVFITHDLDEALRLGDRAGGRIAILNEGRVVQVGTGREILERPADDYVARFVGVVTERARGAG